MQKTIKYAIVLAAVGLLGACSQPKVHEKEQSSQSLANAQVPVDKVLANGVAEYVYELAYSAKQKTVFVAAPGGWGENAKAHKVLRLNPDTLKVEREIILPTAGFGVALDDTNNTLYVGTQDTSIIAIDTETNAIKKVLQLPTGQETDEDGDVSNIHFLRELRLDSKSGRLFVPGISWGKEEGSVLYVVHTPSFALEKVVKNLGLMATGITLDPTSGDVFVSNWEHQIKVIDGQKFVVKKSFDIPVDQPINLLFNSARNELIVIDEGLPKIYKMLKKNDENYKAKSKGNALFVLNPEDGAVLKTFSTGNVPVAGAYNNLTGEYYITNREAGTLSVYDGSANSLQRTILLKNHPNSVAIDAENKTVYVSVKNDDNEPKGALEKVVKINF